MVRRSRGSLAPRILDPVLGLVERVDRNCGAFIPSTTTRCLGFELTRVWVDREYRHDDE